MSVSTMTQDWDIQPRSETCGSCKTAFANQQPYFSRLVFGTEGYARQDFCAPCWANRTPEGELRYSAWQGIFRSPPPPAEETLKKETAESLLRKLIEEQNPARQNAIFILAVMLERKKIFVERDVQVQDGQTTRVYEHRQSGETFVIRDPHLDLNALSHVQQEVSDLLGGAKPAVEREAPVVTAAVESAVPGEVPELADDEMIEADDQDDDDSDEEEEEEDAEDEEADDSDEDEEEDDEEEEDDDDDEEEDDER